MTWSVERRLEFIDFRLYWEGRINRKDLTDFFDISIPQASADLRTYQLKAPQNIDYDKSGKFYFATKQFKPVFKVIDSSHYFSQLRLLFDRVLKKEESFLGMVPSFDSIPSVARVVDSEILRNILKGINEKMSMEINYQSMSRDKSIWRKIAPHTLAYDGFRWHIRAYCYIHNDFRDFLLVRILELRNLQPAAIDPSADSRWNNIVEVKIEPHPGLSDAQKKIIERDYDMKNGVGVLKVRAALYFYLEKHLGLDKGCSLRPAHEQQIVLANRGEIEELMSRYNS